MTREQLEHIIRALRKRLSATPFPSREMRVLAETRLAALAAISRA